MTVIEWVRLSVLIVAVVFSITLSIIVLLKSAKEGFTRKRTATLILVLGFIFITYLAYNIQEIRPAEALQVMLMLGLLSVTGIYAVFTGRQAEASVKMAKEMKEQRIMTSRPYIIQKAEPEKNIDGISLGYFSHFEVHNAGNGPAIELELSLLKEDKNWVESHRETFLRSDAPSIKFSPVSLLSWEEAISGYIVSEYQSILSRDSQNIWYQTWLPFRVSKSSKEGKIYIVAGELQFCEVPEKERIDTFGSRSKPK